MRSNDRVRSTDRRAPGEQAPPVLVELVGLAGVGKSHLNRRLVHALEARCVDVFSVRPSIKHAPDLVKTAIRRAPVFLYLAASPAASPGLKLRHLGKLFYYAWREEIARRQAPSGAILLSQEGWYHKLRKIRKALRPGVCFGDLPPAVRRSAFRADTVIFINPHPRRICERKLRRKGEPVTAETLARQYTWTKQLGQWDEADRTRHDLRDAARLHGLRYLEIDYGDDFDVEAELLPELARLAR